MIASQAMSDYFQKVDHYSGKFIFSDPVLNYLYTTYTVEQRAVVVYSFYNELLRRKAFAFSLQSVLNDEKKHLDFVLKEIQKRDPLWENNMEEAKHFEHQKYFALLHALEREIFDIQPLIKNFHQFSQKQSSLSYNRI